MHLTRSDFLMRDAQSFGGFRNIGDALARVAEGFHGPRDLAKRLHRRWGIDLTTARNLTTRGIASGTTITKAVAAERRHDQAWELWIALGEQLIGESLEAAEERKLAAIIERTQNAEQLAEARRSRRAAVAERARLVDGHLGRRVG